MELPDAQTPSSVSRGGRLFRVRLSPLDGERLGPFGRSDSLLRFEGHDPQGHVGSLGSGTTWVGVDHLCFESVAILGYSYQGKWTLFSLGQILDLPPETGGGGLTGLYLDLTRRTEPGTDQACFRGPGGERQSKRTAVIQGGAIRHSDTPTVQGYPPNGRRRTSSTNRLRTTH